MRSWEIVGVLVAGAAGLLLAGCPSLDGFASGPDAAACGADTTSDSANCGACGHDCGGGDCTGGRCQPVVLVEHSGNWPINGVAFAIDDTSLYTTEGDDVYVCPLDDCAAQQHVLATATWTADVAVDDGFAYWASNSNGTSPDGGSLNDGLIGRVPKDGGAPSTVVSGLANAQTITAADQAIYWGPYYPPGGIYRCPRAGCSTWFTVTSASDTPLAILSDGQAVYWTEQGGSVVKCADLSKGCAGAPTVLATSLGALGNLVSDGTDLYVAVTADPTAQTGSIRKLDKDAMNVTTFLTVPASAAPSWLAIDTSDLYWTTTATGTIHRATLSGGPEETIAVGQVQPRRILAAGAFIYWGNADGTVMRLAK